MLSLLLPIVFAAPVEPELTWSLSIRDQPVGTRTAKLKIQPGDHGTHRILESYTSIDGHLGPVGITFKQRMTAHAQGGDPASFHSVVEQNGDGSEIQGRYTPSGWVVSTNIGGRLRSADYPPGRIDLSTADLMDPESRVTLGRTGAVRLLFSETGEVLEGRVEKLPASTLTIDGQAVDVQGYSWASPEGTSRFWFSSEGYLVRYELQLLGVPITGELTEPPPAGIDDFPVRVGRTEVERIPL